MSQLIFTDKRALKKESEIEKEKAVAEQIDNANKARSCEGLTNPENQAEECAKAFNENLQGETEGKKIDILQSQILNLQLQMEKFFKEKRNSLTSFIEPHEEQEAKDLIEKTLGFPAPPTCGYYITLKVHVRSNKVVAITNEDGSPRLMSDGTQAYLEIPDYTTANDKYTQYVGLVISVGSEAYKGKRFRKSGPWCKVGDWVVFGRQEGPHFLYRDVPFAMVPDDKIYMVVPDPSYVTRG